MIRYGFFKACRVAQKLRPYGLQTVWAPVAAPLEKPLMRLKGAALSAPPWAVYFDRYFQVPIPKTVETASELFNIQILNSNQPDNQYYEFDL